MVGYTDRSRVLTVALGVFKSQTPQTGPDWAGLMAATLVAALPMLVLFMLFGASASSTPSASAASSEAPGMTTIPATDRAPLAVARSPLAASTALRRQRPVSSREPAPSSYWLWDANQQPGYQKCADAFASGRTPASRSRSRSTAGTTTGPSSPPASSPTPHPTCSPTTCPSSPQFADRRSSARSTISARPGHQGRRLPAGPGRTVEVARTASGTAHRRTGTRSRSSTTARSRPPASTAAQLENLDLEPPGRRHVREARRASHHRQERQAGRRARLRQVERQDVRPGLRGSGGGGYGPDAVGGFAGSAGWKRTDKNPWGTKFNHDDPALAADDRAGTRH